ncbi:hypothetical protein LCGC14_1702220 [marine sediment metagenome]|uniref:Uncharacterized protein n=1 Tax=marine sediment metagenome TaxID=412755 RepID=A0A0F9I581_9ZZZZ
MKEKLEHITALAYTSRSCYNSHESIEREIADLIAAHRLNISFRVTTTGVEFTETNFNYTEQKKPVENVDCYFIRY